MSSNITCLLVLAPWWCSCLSSLGRGSVLWITGLLCHWLAGPVLLCESLGPLFIRYEWPFVWIEINLVVCSCYPSIFGRHIWDFTWGASRALWTVSSLPWWFYGAGSLPVCILCVEIWRDLCGVVLCCYVFELGLGLSFICFRQVAVSLLCGKYLSASVSP